jgi:hypothetical protein
MEQIKIPCQHWYMLICQNFLLNQDQCCGSESEIIRMFWLDLNPNPIPIKSSDTDSNSDSDTVVG